MKKFVALLRGINVSGQKIIRMADLRNLFNTLGFESIKTYLQSGNVIFSSEAEKPRLISEQIRTRIIEQFGFDVEVLVLGCQQIKQITEANPFVSPPQKEIKWLHVTFPSQAVTEKVFESLELPVQEGEAAVLAEQAVYLYCPNGYGRTKINNGYFEKKLGFACTTRNWKTVLALTELCQE
jgi:uncharacterized protein (DUF1697 family)